MKKVFRHFREFWWFYLAGLVVAYVLIFVFLADYLNKHYTRDINCTVIDSKIETWGGGRGGRSRALKIQTEECDNLMVYSNIQRGVGFDEVGRNLEPGTKYIFTINKYEVISSYGIVSGIRDSSGGEIDFSPQD